MHTKSSKVCIKTMSTLVSLLFKGLATKHTIVIWTIDTRNTLTTPSPSEHWKFITNTGVESSSDDLISSENIEPAKQVIVTTAFYLEMAEEKKSSGSVLIKLRDQDFT